MVTQAAERISRFGDAGFRILLDASVDLVAHKAGNEIADFGVIEKPYDLVAGLRGQIFIVHEKLLVHRSRHVL